MSRDGTDPEGTSLSSNVPLRRVARRYVLEVLEGSEVGRTFSLDPQTTDSRVLLGQSPACAVSLSDRAVSRRHAALEVEPRGLRLTDLGSTNGTKVNGVWVFDALLLDGDQLRVGDTTLRVRELGEQVLELTPDHRFGKVLGASLEMRRLYPLFARLAASDLPVVIEGETGTGKEVLAESIHEASPRASGPFVVFDCTAIAPNMVEATLFGHERGSFTGALATRPGLFEEADGGTLLIDEIGDLELSLQAKLLRVIERSEVRRIGGSRWLHCNVRILAATRRDLDREVQAGRFREDLFFRLSVARVELPPLRRRSGDISLLATLFWRELGGALEKLTPEMLQRFESCDWPGNVRELRNTIAQRVVLGELAGLSRPSLPPEPADSADPKATIPNDESFLGILKQDLPFPLARDRVLELFERLYVERVLDQHNGHIGQAAKASGIGRRYFQTIRGRRRGNP